MGDSDSCFFEAQIARGVSPSGGMPPPENFSFLHTLRLILKPFLSQIYTPEKSVMYACTATDIVQGILASLISQ